jgi:hypothetical protein
MLGFRLAAGLIALAVAAPAPAPASPAALRHGYALPTDVSPAADGLPRADPPDRPGWNRDLDLPPVDAYEAEVLRFVRSGLGPTLVVQFAVVAPRRPVQVMVLRAADREHPQTASRVFGEVSWATFLRLKAEALPAMSAPPDEPEPLAPGEIRVQAVDIDCSLEYAGAGLTVRRSTGCAAEGPLQDASRALVDAAEAAAPR